MGFSPVRIDGYQYPSTLETQSKDDVTERTFRVTTSVIDDKRDLAPNQKPRQKDSDAERCHATGQHRQRTCGRFHFHLRHVIFIGYEFTYFHVTSKAYACCTAFEVRSILAQHLRSRALTLQLPTRLLHQHHFIFYRQIWVFHDRRITLQNRFGFR